VEKPENSTCSCTGPTGNAGTVARPRSSAITVTGAPLPGVTTIVAAGMPAPVSSMMISRNCCLIGVLCGHRNGRQE
jgi:hypothetical protein